MKLSIIVPEYIIDDEVWELAKQNVESIRKNTKSQYELILVDNGSPLHNDWIKENADIYVKEIINGGNAYGWNQGLKNAKGDYLCLMDNDVTEHSEGWDMKLIEMLDNPKIGIVFPVAWNKEDDGYKIRLVGFCFMLKRNVFDNVGYISEEYGKGNFEDDDYFMRTLDAGYLLKTCREAKIKHYSRGTVDKIPEIGKIWFKNREYYINKFQNRWPKMEDLF